MVTGNNRYYNARPRRHPLAGSLGELIKLSPPGSSHLQGLVFGDRAWRGLGKSARPLTCSARPTTPHRQRSTTSLPARPAKVHQAYKCRVRKIWWQVPLVKPADLFLTYMNADTPRITTNEARVLQLNSVHGIYLHPEHRDLGRELLPLAALVDDACRR